MDNSSRPAYLTDQAINHLIDQALNEDIGPGDFSSLSSIPESAYNKARLIVKDSGILAGVEMAQYIFQKVNSAFRVEVFLKDGAFVNSGDIAFTVEGPAASLLSAERLVLNCMQRMSGIATHTHRYVQLVAGTGCTLLDTRKTTPNFRLAEKWAVLIGGAQNHRYGLYDMVMLKDNHIDFAGGISEAINACKSYLKSQKLNLDIEVETRNLTEVEQVLAVGGVKRIMLDNMSPKQVEEAVVLINKQAETEASGGITDVNLRAYAETGVDFVSLGTLTYGAKPLDLSLKAF